MSSIRQSIRAITQANLGRPLAARVRLEHVQRISPGYTRVTVAGDDLKVYTEPRPADAFKLALPPVGVGPAPLPVPDADGNLTWPPDGPTPEYRAYTVSAFDPDGLRLRFDVLDHEGGVANTWLAQATPGDPIALIGMRVEFVAGDVDRHLVVADPSALPAAAAVIDAIGDSAPVRAVLGITHDDDRRLVRLPEGAEVTWVTGRTPLLEPAVLELPPVPGRVQAWVGGEAADVRAVRRHLQAVGVARDDLQAAAYWRRDRTSTETDAATLVLYQKAIRQGRDLSDPDLADEIDEALAS